MTLGPPLQYSNCIHFQGRCFGALIGRFAYTLYPDNVKYPDNHGPVYAGFAIAAAIIAALYFVAYHFYLKPYCGAHPQLPPYPAPSIVQSKKLCQS